MKMRSLVVAGTLLGMSASVVFAADKKVQMKDLPAAVQQAVQAQTKGATLVGLATEREAGKTLYEAETKVNGKTRDLLFDASGRLLEVEEETSIDSVPPAVKTALASRGKLLRLETLTKGTAVTYEAQVEKNGKKSEVELGADGKIVKK